MARARRRPGCPGDAEQNDHQRTLIGEPTTVKFRDLLVPIGCGAIFLVYTLLASLSQSIVALPGETEYRQEIVSIFPQGWAFFSRSPRDANYAVYTLDGAPQGSVRSLTAWPSTTASNLYGLSREGRSQGVEAASLALKTPPDKWHSCADTPDPALCIEGIASTDPSSVENPVYSPSLCGTVFIAAVRPTAFEFRDLTPIRLAADKVIKVDVACDH